MPRQNPTKALLYIGVGCSGAAGLIYEVVWSRALTNTIGSTVYSFTILLSAFMAGLAIGGHFGGVFAARTKEPLKVFAFLQVGIGVFGGLTFYLINNFESIYGQLFYRLRDSFVQFNVAQLVLVFMAMIIPTSLMGATFPMAVKAGSVSTVEISRGAGDIYAINTWGAVVGVIGAGFLLIPTLGLTTANIVAASINLGIAALTFFFTGFRRGAAASLALLAVPMSLILLKPAGNISFGFGLGDHYASYAEFKALTSGFRLLFDKESQYGRVQVLSSVKYGSGSEKLVLANGGRFEGGTDADVTNQKLLAYLPLAIQTSPDSLLNIGLGTGMTLETAARDRRLRHIDDVEINPIVTEAVKKYFFPRLFLDKRVREITDDARHYLLVTPRKYDVIISEPSYPSSNGEAHLYTKEFYALAAKKMTASGAYVQWLPRYLMTKEDLAVAVKTMGSVFPNLYAWDIDSSSDIILVGLKDERHLDGEKISSRVEGLKDLKLVGWRFSADPKDLDFIIKDPEVPLNLDDLPRIEFSTAYNKITSAQRIR